MRELDYHVVGTTDGGVGQDEVGGSGDEHAQEDKEGSRDYCMPSIELIDTHQPE
ncbi:hypothetical protein GW17_00049563, partial [Ensete ventricosum]